MARGLAGTPVEETGRCARALTALVGGGPALEILPGGARQMTRAAYTARVIATLGAVPWPSAVMRQQDPDDPAFLPALGMHPVLAARERSFLGLPGWPGMAWVDPLGWSGIGDGPSVSVWFGDEEHAWPVGRCPGEFGTGLGRVLQVRSDEGIGIITRSNRGGLELELIHWPIVLEGQLSWAIHARLTVAEGPKRVGRLAIALRPQGPEGASPCFDLSRDRGGIWKADGRPMLALGEDGDEIITSQYGQPDPWHRFSGSLKSTQCQLPGPTHVYCPAGLASGVEISSAVLEPKQSLTRMAILAPGPRVGASLVRTSGQVLWSGATADRKGLLSAGSHFQLTDEPGLFDACRTRLLLEPPRDGLAASVGAVCLARMGFIRRAGERLGRWMDEVRRNGQLSSKSPEDGALLAWAAAEYVRWTGERGWIGEYQDAWTRLLDHLSQQEVPAGGRRIFGLEGSPVWSQIWRVAALLGGSAALRQQVKSHERWAIAGGMARERLNASLGSTPWCAAPGRAPDGASAALLVAPWMGLVPLNHRGVQATVDHIRDHHWHGGGVLLHGGAHTAATALFAGVCSLLNPEYDAVGTVARLASGTYSLPTARHPDRGAVGEGDDPLSAGLFVLMALDRIRVRNGRLTVLPGIASASDLPTPMGRVDIETESDGRIRVYGRWRGTAPELNVIQPR